MGNRPLENKLSGIYRRAGSDYSTPYVDIRGQDVSDTQFRNSVSGLIGRSSLDLGIGDFVADAPSHPKPTAREILSYYGMQDRQYQNQILLSFSDDFREGAKVIQKAFGLAHYHGLEGEFSQTPEFVSNLFVMIAVSIHEYGLLQTNTLLERMGLRLFPISISKTKELEHSLQQPESNLSWASMN